MSNRNKDYDKLLRAAKLVAWGHVNMSIPNNTTAIRKKKYKAHLMAHALLQDRWLEADAD